MNHLPTLSFFLPSTWRGFPSAETEVDQRLEEAVKAVGKATELWQGVERRRVASGSAGTGGRQPAEGC